MRNTRNNGFTLIEIVTTMVILGILAGFAVPLTAKMLESFEYSIYHKDLSETAAVALRRIAREVRRLKNDRSVVTANATTYRFIVDDNGDCIIQFQRNGTDLEREYDGQTDVLATNVLSLSFSYLDDAGNTIATPGVGAGQATDIRFIQVDFTLQENNKNIDCRAQIRPVNVIHYSDLFS